VSILVLATCGTQMRIMLSGVNVCGSEPGRYDLCHARLTIPRLLTSKWPAATLARILGEEASLCPALPVVKFLETLSRSDF
jgi:hypothetical protein